MSTAKKSLPVESKAVVYAGYFLAALKAAKSYTTTREPFIRVALDQGEEKLVITVNPMNQAVAIDVPANWMTIEEPNRDRAFELEDHQILALLATFKASLPKDTDDPDELPLIGIRMTDKRLRFTDETGLGLGIEFIELERTSDDNVSARVEDNISKAFDTAKPGQFVVLSKDQLTLAVASAKKLGHRPRFFPLEIKSEHQEGRTLIICGPLRSLAISYKDAESKTDPEIPTGVSTLHVVHAKPTNGLA